MNAVLTGIVRHCLKIVGYGFYQLVEIDFTNEHLARDWTTVDYFTKYWAACFRHFDCVEYLNNIKQ